VPSWVRFSVHAGVAANLDLFRFSDTPIFEALHAHRAEVVA